ncbi:hypothetical protein [Archangium sp.]|uniref:hypothetical protein n=1 Tax=Archangium sp. TaxID=1872627 RepID=UPI00286BF82D|nr:hypothetical protein [Archangium sp.]
MKWDWKRESERFLTVARNAEIRISELKYKASRSSSSVHKMDHDENLARALFYGHLHGRDFLSTRELLIAYLQTLTAKPHPGAEAFSLETFERAWEHEKSTLLAQLKAGT